MSKHEATPERLGTLSDAILAIIITVLMLNLKAPGSASLQDLLSLWPQGLRYAVSHGLLTIVWINHHYLFRYAVHATPKLLWGNFAHLFAVSVVPLRDILDRRDSLGGHSGSSLCGNIRHDQCNVLNSLLRGGRATSALQLVASREENAQDAVDGHAPRFC
jgi:hypothetical protein